MFELLSEVEVLDTDALIVALGVVDATGSDAQGIDRLSDLERIKGAVCAAQVRITEELRARAVSAETGRRRAQGLLSGPRAEAAASASVGGQVGLARRETPHRGRDLTRLARILVRDLPHTLRLLEAGRISERHAETVVVEISELPSTQRREADERLAGAGADTDLGSLGTADIRDLARRLAFRFDPEGTERRRTRARTRRRVVRRVMPDGMSSIGGLVGDVEAAAVMTSLRRAADLARATDPSEDRTLDQIVADVFVQRLTGQTTAAAAPVAVNLLVSAETLLGDDDSPAHLDGVGPIPAAVARQMVAASPEVRSTIRRLIHHQGTLVALESTARAFTGALRDFVGLRDGARCRMPFCDAPVRHWDHLVPYAEGGPTSSHNAQGLCEACNYVKELHGWTHRPVPGDLLDRHVVDVTTPTGHRHRSRAPDVPGHLPPSRHDYRWGAPLRLSA